MYIIIHLYYKVKVCESSCIFELYKLISYLYTANRIIMDDRFTLITGANSKLGIAICREIASMGYSVIMADDSCNNSIYNQISTQYGVEIIPLEIDLLKPDAAQTIYTYIDSYFDTIDIVVNCGYFNSFHLHYTHFVAVSSQYLAKRMKRHGHGTIINIAQEYSYIKKSHSIDSIIDYSYNLHREYSRFGIQINSISTGKLHASIYRLSKTYRHIFFKISAVNSIDKIAKLTIQTSTSRKQNCMPGWLNYMQIVITERLPKIITRYCKRIFREKSTKL